LESQAYGIGTKGRGLDKYMRFLYDLNLETVKASIQDIYIRNGIRFRAGEIQFKDSAFEFKILYSRDLRRCDMCICRDVEDKRHAVFDCAFYEDLRRDKRWSY
jgi:hypothetical protein